HPNLLELVGSDTDQRRCPTFGAQPPRRTVIHPRKRRPAFRARVNHDVSSYLLRFCQRASRRAIGYSVGFILPPGSTRATNDFTRRGHLPPTVVESASV